MTAAASGVGWVVQDLAARNALVVAQPEVGKLCKVLDGSGSLYTAVASGVGGGIWREYVIGPTQSDIYWDPATGNDANTGLTTVTAVATAVRVASLIGTNVITDVTVHLTHNGGALPDSGLFLTSKLLQGKRIRFLADEVWDPTVYTVTATGTAGAATTGLNITGTFTLGAYNSLTIEFTSIGGVEVPLAQRQRKTIRDNTTTGILPVLGFDPPPIAGDTYRILTPNCYLSAPVIAGPAVSYYVFAQDMAGISASQFDALEAFGGTASLKQTPGVIIEGVGLKHSVSFGFIDFGRLPLYLYGVSARDSIAFHGTTVCAGSNLSGYAQYEGWGLVAKQPRVVRDAWLYGYLWALTSLADIEDGGRVVLLGGRASYLRTSNLLTIYGGLFGLANPFLFQHDGHNPQLQVGVVNLGTNERSIIMLYGDIVITKPSPGIALQVGAGSFVSIGSGVTGPGAVKVDGGGEISCYSAPALGDAAALDWTVVNLAAVNKSFFAGASTGLMDPATGSRVVRTP